MATGVYKITEDFERALCDYTGAPYAIALDNMSNALFLALYYEKNNIFRNIMDEVSKEIMKSVGITTEPLHGQLIPRDMLLNDSIYTDIKKRIPELKKLSYLSILKQQIMYLIQLYHLYFQNIFIFFLKVKIDYFQIFVLTISFNLHDTVFILMMDLQIQQHQHLNFKHFHA